MIALRANLDQLDKICCGLSAKIIFPDPNEWIFEHDFGQSVQRRFTTWHDRYLSFEKEIELSGEWSLGAARAFGDRLNAPEQFGAPGNDQAGVAKLAFAQKNRGRALHGANLARAINRRAGFSDRTNPARR